MKKMVLGFCALTAILTWGCARGPEHAAVVAPSQAAPPAAVETSPVAGVATQGPLPAAVSSANDLGEQTVSSLVVATKEIFTSVCGDAKGVDAITLSLYTKACGKGDGEGCLKVGAMYMCGAGVEKNGPVAVSMFEKACELRSEQGCQFYSGALLEGSLVPRDVSKALSTFEKQCERGSVQACSSLGGLYAMNGVDGDVPHAVAALERACVGLPDACANLSIIESKGMGARAKNPTRAFALAKKSCEDKSMFGCAILGMLYAEGTGVKKDPSAAMQLFTLSCDAGHAQGCLNLAKCHYEGIGTQKDPARAATALRKACDGGAGQACRLLADLSLSSQASPAPTPSEINPVMF